MGSLVGLNTSPKESDVIFGQILSELSWILGCRAGVLELTACWICGEALHQIHTPWNRHWNLTEWDNKLNRETLWDVGHFEVGGHATWPSSCLCRHKHHVKDGWGLFYIRVFPNACDKNKRSQGIQDCLKCVSDIMLNKEHIRLCLPIMVEWKIFSLSFILILSICGWDFTLTWLSFVHAPPLYLIVSCCEGRGYH